MQNELTPSGETEPVWPDEWTEKIMLADANLLESEFEPTSTGADAACHIKALLQRVRELEKRLPWLLRCEAAIQSMAAQFCCPKTSPEEMVDMCLKEDKDAPRQKG